MKVKTSLCFVLSVISLLIPSFLRAGGEREDEKKDAKTTQVRSYNLKEESVARPPILKSNFVKPPTKKSLESPSHTPTITKNNAWTSFTLAPTKRKQSSGSPSPVPRKSDSSVHSSLTPSNNQTDPVKNFLIVSFSGKETRSRENFLIVSGNMRTLPK